MKCLLKAVTYSSCLLASLLLNFPIHSESGSKLLSSKDMKEFVPVFEWYFQKKIEEQKRIIEMYENAIKSVKEDPSLLLSPLNASGPLNASAAESYRDIVKKILNGNNDVGYDSTFIEVLSPKLRAKIKSLSNVNEESIFKDLQDFKSLRHLSFGEYFNYDGKLTIKKGMLPDSLTSLSFYDADSTTVEAGALPKGLKQLLCGDMTQIKGPLPSLVKLLDDSSCKRKSE